MNEDLGLGQIIIDARTQPANLDVIAKSLKEYVGRRLDASAYEESWRIVNDVVRSTESALSKENRTIHKILVNDYWIEYVNLRNSPFPCLGDDKALAYVDVNDRLHPDCERCRKVLVFDLDARFLRKITEEFLVGQLMFEFKIARELGVLVAYCRGGKRREEIMAYLDDFVKSNGLMGRVQWRIGGKYLQDAAPHLFKSAKILNYEI
jgi:hypothetical protein